MPQLRGRYNLTHWAWLRRTRHGSARSTPHRRRATSWCSLWVIPRSHAESPGHRKRPPQHSWATRMTHTQSVHGAFPTGRQLIALHSSPFHSTPFHSVTQRCIHSYHGALDRDNRTTTEHTTNPPRMSSAVSPATNQARCSHGVRRAWYKINSVHDLGPAGMHHAKAAVRCTRNAPHAEHCEPRPTV